VFYSWLDIILKLEPDGQIPFKVLYIVSNGVSIDIGSMALFRCDSDPRTVKYPIGNIPIPRGHPLPRDLEDLMTEGHYMIFQYGNSGSIHLKCLCSTFCSREAEKTFYLCLAAARSLRIQEAEKFSLTDLHPLSEQYIFIPESCKPFLRFSCFNLNINLGYCNSHRRAHEG
jgi:hypothetical protein